MVTATGVAGPHIRPAEHTVWRLLAMNVFKFGGDGAHWLPISTVLLPLSAGLLVARAEAPLVVSQATAAGAVFAVLVPIVVGYLSDRTTGRWGRRRPWMVGGTILNLFGLGLLAGAGSVPALIAAYLLLQVSNNTAFAAYNAVIPDLVPLHQSGRASGLLNAMGQLGTVAGLTVLTLVTRSLGSTRPGALVGYLALSLILAGSLTVSAAAIPERPVERLRRTAVRVTRPLLLGGAGAVLALAALEIVLLAPRSPILIAVAAAGVGAAAIAAAAAARVPQVRSALSPLRERDFFWVLATRFFNTFGLWTIAPFVFYFFRDVVRSENPALESSLWLLALIGGGVLPAAAGGYLSDRLGGRRKVFVYVSSALQAAVASVLLFTLVQDRAVVYLLGCLFGLGYGIYQAVDWALACDVLPDRERGAAKDMALFHVSFTLPQVMAPALAGEALYWLNQAGGNLGYRFVFASAAVWFVFSTVFVRRIRGAR